MLPKLVHSVFSLVLFLFGISVKSEDSFLVVAHNVENLFDYDGESLYEDYQKKYYGERELRNKLDALVRTLKKIGGNTGPDIILFQEVEVDRTPMQFPSSTEILLNRLEEEGIGPYYHALGYDSEDSQDKWPAVHCLTLSKFPIDEIQLHPIRMARPILETKILVNGHPFILFNCHWKSGASSMEMETHRLQNAQVLKNRIDALTKKDPFLDFLVGGDLNSHYNQSVVYQEQMKTTGINDVLLSENIEPIGGKTGSSLYNLWHELPPHKRASDAWRGNWGTLMHLIVPKGLYDDKGIRYENDSYEVGIFEGINAIPGSVLPFKWSNDLGGFGCSDHFPVFARFRTSGYSPAGGNTYPEVENSARPVDYTSAFESAIIWTPQSLQPSNYGRTFLFSGTISDNNPLTIKCGGHRLGLYSFNQKARNKLFSMVKGEEVSGFGHLSRYRGQWQLIVEKEDWIK